jgi:hypothetical protein
VGRSRPEWGAYQTSPSRSEPSFDGFGWSAPVLTVIFGFTRTRTGMTSEGRSRRPWRAIVLSRTQQVTARPVATTRPASGVAYW